jgi:hypothetical protein
MINEDNKKAHIIRRILGYGWEQTAEKDFKIPKTIIKSLNESSSRTYRKIDISNLPS